MLVFIFLEFGRYKDNECQLYFYTRCLILCTHLTEEPKIRYQKSNDVETIANELGIDITLLSRYAEAMSEKNSSAAMNALHDMKAKYLKEHRAEKNALMERDGISSLLANSRLFAPIQKAIKEQFGDADTLVQERIKQAEQERNMMQAARKRAEEEAHKREERIDELSQLSEEDIDQQYTDALAKGDETTAREMLNEAARRKGYSDAESEYQGVGAWVAPCDPGYESDEARRNAVDEDSPDLNVADMAAGYNNQPQDIFEHPNKYSQGSSTSVESGRAIQTAIDAIRSGKKDVRVKVYRAVPTSVKEGKLRNGDWVTPSRRYAEMHGENRLEGKYRIIEDEVPANELWWDSNDVNEWGYDNGNDYRYKNAKNNRKLNDLITRDDKGNIIPPSKRFNSRKADERYQKTDGTTHVSESEAIAREVFTDLARKALGDDSVITDGEFGQSVLDEANEKVRRMSFGEPYDYEKYPRGRVEPNLAEKSVSVVKADANHGFTNYKAAKSWAKQNISKVYNNEETGGKGTVRISNAAIDKFLSQSAVDKSESKDVHMSVLKVLPDVLKTSIDAETHPDFLKGENGKRNVENGVNRDVLVHRCYGAVSIDGKPYRVKITLKENVKTKESTNTHSYEATKIELLAGQHGDVTRTSPRYSNNSITAAKLLNGVEMSYDSGKKLLEESEKRSEKVREQRVYHGSGADFDHFDHSHMGEGEGAQAYGWGTYVTEVEGIGRTYANNSALNNAEYRKLRDNLIKHGTRRDSLKQEVEKEIRKLTREKHSLEKAKKNSEIENLSQNEKVSAKKEVEKHEGRVREIQERIDTYQQQIEDAENNFAEAKSRYDESQAKRHLYTVEIPDNNGHNYLDWTGYVNQETLRKLAKKIDADEEVKEKLISLSKASNLPKDYDTLARLNYAFGTGGELKRTGDYLYDLINLLYGSPKAASNTLSEMGFVGIKYPANYRNGGSEYGAKNYVIFNENDAKITDHVRYFRTPTGEAYGFTLGGKIYIDPRVATADTPIHEYSHLWATAMQKNNPEEWKNIVGLMKGTSVWKEVKKNYPELTDESEIADEVLATYSGRKGAERLREEMRKAAEGKGSPLEKAEAVSVLQRIKLALDKFWKGVADFLHIHYTTAEEVADRVMKDLIDGVDPRKFGVDNKVRKQFVGERGAKEADHAEEVTTRLDNLGVAREMEKADKDAKAIKMATGWERGADGKWRYEIPEGKYFPKGDAEYEKVRDKQSWSKELDLLSDRIFDGEELSTEENKRFEQLADEEAKFKAEYLTREKPYLADWLKNDELFKSYPELKGVEIVFTDNLPKTTSGYYSERDGKIVVNTNSTESTERIIAHEIQHAIQRIEGFARGGNPETIRQQIEDYVSENEEDVEMTKSTIKSAFDLFAKATKLEIIYPKMIKSDVEWQRQTATDAYWDALNTIDDGFRHFETDVKNDYSQFKGMSPYEIARTGYHVKETIEELKRMSDEYLNSLTDDDRYLEELVDRYKKALESDSDAVLYTKLSGEVEARNVERRMSMSPEERRTSLSADTEDVSRSDQIFLGVSDANQSEYTDYKVSPAEMSESEKAERGEKLMNAPVVEVKSNQIVRTEKMSARQAAEKWWKENIGKPLFYQTEVGQVEINEKSIGSSLAHRYGQPKLDAITSLKDGFENAVYLGTMPDFTRQDGVNNHYFAYPIEYDGKRNYVFCRALQDNNKNRLYVHEVFLAENLQKEGNTLQTAASQPHGGIALYKNILSNVLSAAKVENKSNTLQQSSDKNLYRLKDGTFIKSGSYFSGGGLLEEGLKRYLDPSIAVEFNEKISGVYADNFGNHIVTADVRDVDPRELAKKIDGEVQYFHASPVCKNYSRAKREGGEVELDKETAQSTADFISAKRPKVVTIENVKGYKNSEALKIITDELTKQGYDWDMDVYNAADYGGYTKVKD